jgi:hypothetical protein
MSASTPTGTTGTNRVRTGTRTPVEPTGTTGTTGIRKDPVDRDPVPPHQHPNRDQPKETTR